MDNVVDDDAPKVVTANDTHPTNDKAYVDNIINNILIDGDSTEDNHSPPGVKIINDIPYWELKQSNSSYQWVFCKTECK